VCKQIGQPKLYYYNRHGTRGVVNFYQRSHFQKSIMEDPRTQNLKENYNQWVLSVAKQVYLKQRECVRDLNEAKIREEDKNAIRLHLVRMVLEEMGQNPNRK